MSSIQVIDDDVRSPDLVSEKIRLEERSICWAEPGQAAVDRTPARTSELMMTAAADLLAA